MNILMFGTGGLAQYLTTRIRDDIKILAYINSNEFENAVNGIPVIPIESIVKYDYDYIIVGFSDVERGKLLLLQQGIPKDKIVCYHFNGAYNYQNNPYQLKIDGYLDGEWNSKVVSELFMVPEKKYYLCSMNLADD